MQLPLCTKAEDPASGLAFEFLADPEPGAVALSGHADGVIVINIAEADDAERERRRISLHEPYRTLLGHFRHEIGHYYWDRLIQNSDRLPAFRELLGDETQDKEAPSVSHTILLEHGQSFDRKIEAWFPLTYLINNLNRGLGLPDGYPFVLSAPAIEKLRFVHETIEAIIKLRLQPGGRQGTSPCRSSRGSQDSGAGSGEVKSAITHLFRRAGLRQLPDRRSLSGAPDKSTRPGADAARLACLQEQGRGFHCRRLSRGTALKAATRGFQARGLRPKIRAASIHTQWSSRAKHQEDHNAGRSEGH